MPKPFGSKPFGFKVVDDGEPKKAAAAPAIKTIAESELPSRYPARRGQPEPAAASERVRENRLRRMAFRQRLRLIKSRRRDPRAYDFGGYMIVDNRNIVVAGGNPLAFSLTLDHVENFLLGKRSGS